MTRRAKHRGGTRCLQVLMWLAIGNPRVAQKPTNHFTPSLGLLIRPFIQQAFITCPLHANRHEGHVSLTSPRSTPRGDMSSPLH